MKRVILFPLAKGKTSFILRILAILAVIWMFFEVTIDSFPKPIVTAYSSYIISKRLDDIDLEIKQRGLPSEIITLIETAKLNSLVLIKQIRYINDRLDEVIEYDENDIDNEVLSPYQLIDKKLGDCEDFAILKYYILKYMGVEDTYIFFGTVEAGKHSVAIFELEGKYYFADFSEVYTEKDYINFYRPIVADYVYHNGKMVDFKSFNE